MSLSYNRRVEQDGLDGGWASPSRAFAYFEARLDPARAIRDYLVRVDAGSDELLLGRAFVALGPLRPSPTYIVLERPPPD